MLINVKNTNGGYEELKHAWKMWLNGPRFVEKVEYQHKFYYFIFLFLV